MDFDTQMQLLCWLCLVPMGIVFVLAVLYSWTHPGPEPTPQERQRQQEQAEELMGEILLSEERRKRKRF